MKTIDISKGQIVLVDDEDFNWLSKHKWYFSHGYAVRYYGREDNKQKIARMHREIMTYSGYDILNKQIDHIDGNGLNNTKSNLRIVTQSQNLQNRGKPSNNTSGYKGVSFSKIINKWEAYITVRGHRIRLGYFDTAKDAAHAYDLAAVDYHGEFAVLNFSTTQIPVLRKLQALQANNRTGYRGVSYRSDNGKWRMDFQYFGKRQTATFDSAIEAAQAYDNLARKYVGASARLNFPHYSSDEISLNIQQLIRSYYTQWMQVGQHRLPDLTDCLDFMLTEISEAIELRLRRTPYIRNNPRELPSNKEIGIEIFDAIMMGCIALDILKLDLQEIALEKLEYMRKKRMKSETRSVN